jgi:hypothetical protein
MFAVEGSMKKVTEDDRALALRWLGQVNSGANSFANTVFPAGNFPVGIESRFRHNLGTKPNDPNLLATPTAN